MALLPGKLLGILIAAAVVRHGLNAFLLLYNLNFLIFLALIVGNHLAEQYLLRLWGRIVRKGYLLQIRQLGNHDCQIKWRRAHNYFTIYSSNNTLSNLPSVTYWFTTSKSSCRNFSTLFSSDKN